MLLKLFQGSWVIQTSTLCSRQSYSDNLCQKEENPQSIALKRVIELMTERAQQALYFVLERYHHKTYSYIEGECWKLIMKSLEERLFISLGSYLNAFSLYFKMNCSLYQLFCLSRFRILLWLYKLDHWVLGWAICPRLYFPTYASPFVL